MQVSVFYETEDGTATAADNDYTPCKGTLVFEPMQEKATVEIAIMDDDFYEPDEEFYLKLSNPSHNGEVRLRPNLKSCNRGGRQGALAALSWSVRLMTCTLASHSSRFPDPLLRIPWSHDPLGYGATRCSLCKGPRKGPCDGSDGGPVQRTLVPGQMDPHPLRCFMR